VKRALFSLLFFSLYLSLFCQENPNSEQLQTSLKVRQLIDKKATYNRLNNGEYDGYRIKIHFGVDRVKAREVKTKFSGKFSDINAYEDYAQPNFVITVGDFRTKLEAFEALKKIQSEFPNSFIVKSKIRPMRL
jgi:hypothetical protein